MRLQTAATIPPLFPPDGPDTGIEKPDPDDWLELRKRTRNGMMLDALHLLLMREALPFMPWM